MFKSITRFLYLIPAIILIYYLAVQFAEPSGQTIDHWLSPTETKKCIAEVKQKDWHQAWFHASRVFTTEGYILAALLFFSLFGIKGYFSASRKRALATVCKFDDLHCKANSLGNMGLTCSESGQHQKAIGYFEQALAISKKIGDHQVTGTTLGNLGNEYQLLGNLKKAIGYHQQALAVFRKIGDHQGEGSVLGNLGRIFSACGQLDKAILYNKQSLSIFEKINSPIAGHMRKWVAELESRRKCPNTKTK